MTCTTNKWRVKIDWKEVYNVRDPPRMGDRRKESRRREKEESSVHLHGLENHFNLILKVEEEEH